MSTYTIATVNTLLLACVPDGADIAEAVRKVEAEAGVDAGEYDVTEGLTLTDDLDRFADTHPAATLVFSCGPHTGMLVDEKGFEYGYAIRLQ